MYCLSGTKFATRRSVAGRAQGLEREPQRGGQVRVRLVGPAEGREQLAERDVRAPVVVEREARAQVRLGLAPQLLALAQAPERVQQRGVLGMTGQPALGRLELARRIGTVALGVPLHELRVPVALERAFDELDGLAVATHRQEGARRRLGDHRLQPVRLAQPVPVRAQARRVGGKGRERVGVRACPQGRALVRELTRRPKMDAIS